VGPGRLDAGVLLGRVLPVRAVWRAGTVVRAGGRRLDPSFGTACPDWIRGGGEVECCRRTRFAFTDFELSIRHLQCPDSDHDAICHFDIEPSSHLKFYRLPVARVRFVVYA
jgi:hypothetical protein